MTGRGAQAGHIEHDLWYVLPGTRRNDCRPAENLDRLHDPQQARRNSSWNSRFLPTPVLEPSRFLQRSSLSTRETGSFVPEVMS